MTSPQDYANRYIEVFNEPDEAIRNKAISGLWAPNGTHLGGFEATGYKGLEEGIQGSHNNNIRDKGMIFRARPNAQRKRDLIVFTWDALSQKDESLVMATGIQILELDTEGHISIDYTFVQ